MSTVKVKALTDFSFDGVDYKKGEEISVPAEMARICINIDYVKEVTKPTKEADKK